MRHAVILALATLCLAAPASWAQKRGGTPRGGIIPSSPAGAASPGPTSTAPGAPGYTGSTGARPGAPGNMGSTGARPGPR